MSIKIKMQQRTTPFALLAVALLAGCMVLAGCGGSSTAPPPPPGSGTISGQVLNVQDPSNLQVQLDGLQLEVAPDSEGNFSIPNVPPGDHVISFLDPTTNTGAHLSVDVGSGQTTDVGDVTLAFGGMIAGIVSQVDEAGNLLPLAGVEVVAESIEYPIMETEPRQESPLPVPSLRLVAFTVEDGSYTMRAVPSGNYQVSVVVPGLEAAIQWIWVEVGRTTPCDFILRPSFEPGVGTVQGTVTAADAAGANGQPVVGALVSIYSQFPYYPIVSPETIAEAARRGRQGAIAPPYWDWRVFSTLTDDQGHYSLNVPAGYQTVEVYAEGYEWTSQSIQVVADETITVDFVLLPWTEPVPLPGTEPGGGEGGTSTN